MDILNRILKRNGASEKPGIAALREGRVPALHEFLELLSPELVEEIDSKDAMHWGNKDHYFGVGVSALQCIRLAILAAGKEEIRNILDLPCGHGRVLRMLRAVFNDARIVACDLDTDGVDFCAKAFDAIPVYSKESPDEIEIDGQFDLIWCGSLLIHLDSNRWPGFLRLFSRLLAPGGILVFTTQGRCAAARILKENFYGITPEQTTQVVEAYHKTGFGYHDYDWMPGYGVSLSALPWVLTTVQKQSDLRVIALQEQGWDNHQDVIGCVRSS
jgi:SAM-dependent methyltransferase